MTYLTIMDVKNNYLPEINNRCIATYQDGEIIVLLQIDMEGGLVS